MIGPGLKAFWLVWVLGFAGVALAPFLGPRLEAAYAPVRIDHAVGDTHRVPVRGQDALCWTWSSTKVRDRISDDVDVYVHAGGDRHVLSVWRESDGRSWSRGAATGLGRTDQRWCVTVPPSVAPGERVRVEWRAWYPGLLGLWRVPLPLPDVVHPPE